MIAGIGELMIKVTDVCLDLLAHLTAKSNKYPILIKCIPINGKEQFIKGLKIETVSDGPYIL